MANDIVASGGSKGDDNSLADRLNSLHKVGTHFRCGSVGGTPGGDDGSLVMKAWLDDW